MELRAALPRILSALTALCLSSAPAVGAAAEAGVVPRDLRSESLVDPLGIDVARPRLSWTLDAIAPGARGLLQTSYRIIVASTSEALARSEGDLWDSGKVESSRSSQVPYGGRPLGSRARAWWKVQVWDEKDAASEWSEPASWSMGLLEPGDWTGSWIGKDEGAGTIDAPLRESTWIWFPEGEPATSAPLGSCRFRKTFEVPAGLASPRGALVVTADNGFTAFLNGARLGGGSNFNQAHELDLTGGLRPGRNVVAIEAENVGDAPNPAGLIAEIRVEFPGRDPIALRTDPSWKASRDAPAGWQVPAFDDSSWVAAKALGAWGIGPWKEVGRREVRRLAARWLRKEFTVEKPVRRAVVHASGLGLSELELNGRKVGDHVLSPALTEYTKRVPYVTHDVTGGIRTGRNALGAILGNGRFYAPRLSVPTETRTYGYPKLILNLRVEHEDGTSLDVTTDETWRLTTEGPIRSNCEYDGEEHDARMEMDGWSLPGFDDRGWEPARKLEAPGGALRAQTIEPIRVVETLHPIELTQPRPGTYVFDMGQNMVGWCRLRVTGPRGTAVTLRHAETLRPDGTLYLDNIRSAKVTDTYVLKGGGAETWEPRFTYHGFRYVELRGFPGTPTLSTLEGRVVHDDLGRAGSFVCSNPLINRIHRNIDWGIRGNYRSIPTDCPQRDERQGWLGDRSAESRGEACLFDLAAFYPKWLADIRDSQKENGSVPDVAPPYWPIYSDNITWPSSLVIIPGHLHDQYGDVRVLEDNWAAMEKWLDHMRGFLKDGIMTRDSYGDWCVPPEEQHLIHSQDPARKTPGDFIASAYYYHDHVLMSRYARILGRPADAERYAKLADDLKAAFNRKFLDAANARYANGSQTSSVLPLAMGIAPEALRGRIFDALVEKIERESKGHIGTGLIGAQWLMRLLSDGGRPDLAYSIASKDTYPSWGYMVRKDATTIWELWNGDTADPAMNSGNHVMLVGDLLIWLHEYVGGIRTDPAAPGFERVLIRPVPCGDLAFARTSRVTPRGAVFTDWRLDGARFRLDVTIPPGGIATVWVPAKDGATVTEGGRPAAEAPGVRAARREAGHAVFEVGSGTYAFESSGR